MHRLNIGTHFTPLAKYIYEFVNLVTVVNIVAAYKKNIYSQECRMIYIMTNAWKLSSGY